MENHTTDFKISVHMRPVQNMGNLKAFASLTFETEDLGKFFAVNGVKVVEGKSGLFIGMPRVKDKKGEYRDICFPVSVEFRKIIADAVISEYTKASGETNEAAIHPSIMQPLKEAAQIARSNPAPSASAEQTPDICL
jgi:stage V sporulation protein G